MESTRRARPEVGGETSSPDRADDLEVPRVGADEGPPRAKRDGAASGPDEALPSGADGPRAGPTWAHAPGARDGAALGDRRPAVLVVEDEPTIRSMIARWLRDRGFGVLEAADGPLALAALAGHEGPLDLLLTDVVMPGLGGQELARLLQAERPSLRVLFMSAHAPYGASWEDEVPGPMLEKPFLADALVRAVRAALA